MNKFIKSKTGYKFELTEFGLELSRIRSKFEVNSSCYKQYQHNVPKSWIDNGYVIEVKE